jgi:hypothetical protein
MSDALPPFDDLMTAFARLRPSDEATRRKIATLVGFGLRETPAEKPKDTTPPPKPTTKKPKETPPPPIVTPTATTPPVDAPPSAEKVSQEVPFVLQPAARERRTSDWVGVQPLTQLSADPIAPPSIEPLFVPRWMRGILTAAAATTAPHGPIDVASIVRTVGRGSTFRRIPRLDAPAMARAVQVLVDASDAMLPFADDVVWMVGKIQSIAGRDRTEVLGFEARDEFRAGKGARFLWEPFPATHAPLPGMAVLLLTDLGIGRVPYGPWLPPERWAAFIRALQKRDANVVAFVPYPSRRWPRTLRRLLPIVQWDVSTTVRGVRKSVGRVRRQTNTFER